MTTFHDSGSVCNARLRACPLGISADGHIEASSVEEFESKLAQKMEGSLFPGSPRSVEELTEEAERSFNYELSEYAGTPYDDSTPLTDGAKIDGLANDLLDRMEDESTSAEDADGLLFYISAAESQGRISEKTTQRAQDTVRSLVSKGKLTPGFDPQSYFDPANG